MQRNGNTTLITTVIFVLAPPTVYHPVTPLGLPHTAAISALQAVDAGGGEVISKQDRNDDQYDQEAA